MSNPSTLFVVATPLGNLGDITLRALETLRSVEVILCEDKRVTTRLLNRFGIRKPLVVYHQHTPPERVLRRLGLGQGGKTMALVTDAGTPGISDPGGKLVEALRRSIPDVRILPIPGPTALTAALSVSGFPTDTFVFLGFPPHKKGRQKFFDALEHESRTVVLYESTHRILKTLEELRLRLRDRSVVVCRELTKMHETLYPGTLGEVTEELTRGDHRGEFVVVVRAAPSRKLPRPKREGV
jgi:16S rRNA (cytidine1402-2'-O)-methyltransferase